ncbi:MAG: tetratricopeptide repeat protein [Chlorobi bacterium]|nr:tetratricopeptide repeat protein [Chlorobiota bacterium]
MEFLKVSKRSITILAFALAAVPGFSQNNDEFLEAFKQSYSIESAGNFSGAAEVLKKVYKEDSYALNLRLGWLGYEAGQFMESQSYYNKAISLYPMSVEARLGVVLPAAAMGNWDFVITQYEKILEISPNQSVALYRLGAIYYGRQDYEKAFNYLEKVINLYPFDYDSVVLFAWTNFHLKKFREAKVLFYQALYRKPDDTSALEGLKLIQ